MRPIIPLLLSLLCAATPLFANDSGFKTGLNFTPGLFYNGRFDPAYNGSALELTYLHGRERLLLEGGLEIGANAGGWDFFIPVSVGLNFLKRDRVSLDGLVTVLPGLKLARPSAPFLFAFEASCRLGVTLSPKTKLLFSLGPRYTTCPYYVQNIGPYQYVDLTVGLALVRMKGKAKDAP